MNTILSNKRWCFGIAVFLLILQLFILKDEVLYTFGPDAYSYVDAAKKFWNEFLPYATRPLGISLLLGIPIGITNELNSIILIYVMFNCLFWLLSLRTIYSIILEQTNSEKRSGLGVILFAFHVSILVQVFLVLSEMVFIYFLLILIRYLQLYMARKENKYLNFALTTVLLMVLIKPMAIYMALVLSVFWLFKVVKNMRIEMSLIPLSVALIAILLQVFMMKRTYGEFKISYIDNITWYYYLGAQSKAFESETTYTTVRNNRYQNLDLEGWEKKVPEAKADFSEQLKSNKKNIVKAYFANLASNFFVGNPVLKNKIHDSLDPSVLVKGFYRISKWQNTMYNSLLMFSIVWLLISIVRKGLRSVLNIHFIIIGISCYIFAISGITFTQGDRLTIITQPLLLILVLTNCILPNNKRKNTEHAI